MRRPLTILRLIFWDWGQLTFGSGTSLIIVFVMAAQGNWLAALGFLGTAMFAALGFAQGLVGDSWMADALAAQDALLELRQQGEQSAAMRGQG